MFPKKLLAVFLVSVFIFSCNKNSVDPETDSGENIAYVKSSLDELELESDYSRQETEVQTITLKNSTATINGTGAFVMGNKVLITKRLKKSIQKNA
jgi:hypothetical protein